MKLPALTVSANGHFLVTAQGQPFFWLGDTAWELFHRCTREDAELYLENRRLKGFNVIQAVALPEIEMIEPNAYGHPPLHDQNPLHPNEAYFQHVDWVIHLAGAKGLYIGLLPTWGDKVYLSWGAGPVIFDTQTAYAYGAWIGARYRDYANVIWILGGDREVYTATQDFAPVWRAMAQGIRQHSRALMTYHPQGWRSSAMGLHHEAWLDLNMWQSGHMQTDLPIWEWITEDYTRTPPKPVLDGEPNYEDHPINPFTREWQPEYGRFNDLDVRKQGYRSVFAGACGYTYGHHAVWQFYAPPHLPINFAEPDWRTALDRPGAFQIGHLRRLMETRPYCSLHRIPDQQLILSDPGTGATHIRASRDRDGAWALLYLPQAGQQVQLDLSRLTSAKMLAQWYDPRQGRFSIPFDVPSDGSFTSPAEGPDWVLAIQKNQEL